jgi:serine/threonine protein kinase
MRQSATGVSIAAGSLVDGRYRVEEPLGSGAASRVYRAVDEVLDRPVALKVFPQTGDEPAGRAPDDHLREARLLARLDHPHLVELYDAGEDDGIGWTVMRLVGGGTLADRCRTGPLPCAEVAAVGAQVAGALAYAHAHGIVHRDVKPANVLLEPDGSALLADLGIARLVGASRTTAVGMILGTPAYLSPEQVRGEPVTVASDVYSLALVLVECLAGAPPYPGDGVETALARLSRPPVVPADVPPALAGLLTEMTATQAGARPTAAEVARRLAVVAEQPGPTRRLLVPPVPPEPRRRADRPDDRGGRVGAFTWLVALALAGLLGAVLLTALAMGALRGPGSAGTGSGTSGGVPPPVRSTVVPSPAPLGPGNENQGDNGNGKDNGHHGHGDGNGQGDGG